MIHPGEYLYCGPKIIVLANVIIIKSIMVVRLVVGHHKKKYI